MLNIGILGCSEIAYRRFMPAALEIDKIKVVAVAEEYDKGKLGPFCMEYGLEAEAGFEGVLRREDIHAVYIPQPPALHYEWARRALEAGKHVLVEKPSTTSRQQTEELVGLAASRGLALHENYMFQYHSQLGEIQRMVRDGRVGGVRLIRASFGFPLRGGDDFRYSRKLGGGALLDAGGYVIKLATLLLGDSIKVDAAQLGGLPGYGVDMFGSATLSNDLGQVCQVGFGMDCHYACSLEIWGSRGRIYTGRIFTAPPDYEPVALVEAMGEAKEVRLGRDSHFRRSIEAFYGEVTDEGKRVGMYREMALQSRLVDDVLSCSLRQQG